MASPPDLFSNLTSEETFEIHKLIDHVLFHHENQMINDVSDTTSMNFGLTNPVLIEDAIDDSIEMDWLENSSVPPIFSIQDSPSEETMPYSMIVFSDLLLQSTALLLGHTNTNADQDDQCPLSIEESKSLDDLIRMQQTH